MTMEVSLLAAILAGIISFLSPCVLPVVPAYLGQLGVVVVRTPEEIAAGVDAPAAGSWGRGRGWRRSPCPSRRKAAMACPRRRPQGSPQTGRGRWRRKKELL